MPVVIVFVFVFVPVTTIVVAVSIPTVVIAITVAAVAISPLRAAVGCTGVQRGSKDRWDLSAINSRGDCVGARRRKGRTRPEGD